MTWPTLIEQVAELKDEWRGQLRELEARHVQDVSNLRAEIVRGFSNIEERFNGHEAWHTQQLANSVQGAPTLAINKVMAWVSVLSLVTAMVALLIPHLH